MEGQRKAASKEDRSRASTCAVLSVAHRDGTRGVAWKYWAASCSKNRFLILSPTVTVMLQLQRPPPSSRDRLVVMEQEHLCLLTAQALQAGEEEGEGGDEERQVRADDPVPAQARQALILSSPLVLCKINRHVRVR
eukprot:765307-Hanusia_phi.AAC.3